MNTELKKAIAVFFIGFITFGIGNLIFLYVFSDKTCTFCDGKIIIPMREVVLNIITLGIYGAVWTYKMGKKADMLEDCENVTPITMMCAVVSLFPIRCFSMAVIYYRLKINEGI